MTTIHLIRHGQASAGTDDYDRLSELGQRQAMVLGEWWRSTGFTADAVFAGAMQRQQHTAQLALASAEFDMPCQELVHLDEYDHYAVDKHFGQGIRTDVPSGLSFTDYLAVMQRWQQANPAALKGTEPWHEFERRGWRAVQQALELATNQGRLLMFTSGGIIATVLRHVLHLDFQPTLELAWRIRNASVTTLEYDGSSARLLDFNTIAHFDASADPELVTLM